MKIEKRYLSLPISAQLEVTDCCNHRCIHCYNLDSEIQNRPIRQVVDETVLKCAQKLIDNKVFSVVVTGGEPLMKKELTKKVITLLKESEIKVSLNSNLTLFDDDFIDFLRDNNINVLTSCPSGIPTSFKKLVGVDNYTSFETNVKKLVAKGIRFTINMVITKENLFEIRSTAEKMKSLGCKSFAATPMGLNVTYPRLDLLLNVDDVKTVITDLLWIETNLKLNVDILEALPKCVFPETVLAENHAFLKRKCQAGRTVIAVSCNGDVRPCAHNPYSYGNLLEDELLDIWKRMSDWRSAKYVPKKCQNCSWLNRCNGGCRTNAKGYYNDWSVLDMWSSGNISRPIKNGSILNIEPQTLLQYAAYNITTRKEREDSFVIYNIDNDEVIMVNQSLFDFIISLKNTPSISFQELCSINGKKTDDYSFINTIRFLINKSFLSII